jgi:hypothetical protein
VTVRALLVPALLLEALAGTAVAGDPIDDPKLARRLGERVEGADAVPADAAAAPAETVSRAATVTRPAGPGVPHIKLGFRRFDFVRVGATTPGSSDGTAASEPFDVLSIDLYPVSSYVRFGTSTQYGWQGGSLSGGDYFIAQSFSLGAQLPHRQITPFAEGFVGGGYMRRVQFDRSIPTAYWHLGVDAGAEIYMSRLAYFSVALGYLHPVNGFAGANLATGSESFISVFVDTWSFKLGIGL